MRTGGQTEEFVFRLLSILKDDPYCGAQIQNTIQRNSGSKNVFFPVHSSSVYSLEKEVKKIDFKHRLMDLLEVSIHRLSIQKRGIYDA
jgi:DNA-binding PadR family transcriptional regulator